MNDPIELLMDRLPYVARSGRGWMARCPAHEDGRASLAINVGADGRALVFCHAGCSTVEVCAALGLKLADLMAPDDALTLTKPRRRTARGGIVNARPEKRPVRTFATAARAVAALESQHGPRSAWWTYHDLTGSPVGLVIRWDRPNGKDIRPISLAADGWILRGMAAPRPLYRLPDLTNARRVYVLEGEKAADAAWSIGLVATTSAHGSRSADKTDWTPLAGRECVLLPDNDEAGERYADEVVAILTRLKPAPSVKVLRLPGLPPGGDLADLVAGIGGVL